MYDLTHAHTHAHTYILKKPYSLFIYDDERRYCLRLAGRIVFDVIDVIPDFNDWGSLVK